MLSASWRPCCNKDVLYLLFVIQIRPEPADDLSCQLVQQVCMRVVIDLVAFDQEADHVIFRAFLTDQIDGVGQILPDVGSQRFDDQFPFPSAGS